MDIVIYIIAIAVMFYIVWNNGNKPKF